MENNANQMNHPTQPDRPVWLGVNEIMARYSCSKAKAYSLITAIRSFCGGGKLWAGRVLMSEVEYWENEVIKERVRL